MKHSISATHKLYLPTDMIMTFQTHMQSHLIIACHLRADFTMHRKVHLSFWQEYKPRCNICWWILYKLHQNDCTQFEGDSEWTAIRTCIQHQIHLKFLANVACMIFTHPNSLDPYVGLSTAVITMLEYLLRVLWGYSAIIVTGATVHEVAVAYP